MAFYKALDFTFNPQFTDDTAACIVISEHNYAMLLTHEKFKSFATKPIPDAHETTGVLVAIVDASLGGVSSSLAAAALAARRLPFIVLSGYSLKQQKAAFPNAHCIQKPCRPQQLISPLNAIRPQE